MRWFLTLVALVVVLVPTVAAEEKALQDLPLDQRLDKAAKWLVSQQHQKWGTWHPVVPDPLRYKRGERMPYGSTAFVLYTLLECGYTKKDKVIKAGHEWLLEHARHTQIWNSKSRWKKGDPLGMSTYEISALILYLEARNRHVPKSSKRKKKKKRPPSDNPKKPPRWSKFETDDWRWMHEGVIYLTKGIPPAPKRRAYKGCQNLQGLWRYGQRRSNMADSHATHFVLTALRAASRAGYPVPLEVWTRALAGLRWTFRADDGFAYEKGGSARIQTTAAVIASTYICREQIALLGEKVPGRVDLIRARLKAFDKRYYVSRLDLRREPEEGERDTTLRGFLDPLGGGRVPAIYFTNYLWMVEQLATLSERKQFRGESWHAAGKETLLAVQQESGAFDDWTMVQPKQILATCFALHFLKRTTPPPRKPAR